MQKEIIISLLALCLFTLPASAWEMTLEDADTEAGNPYDVFSINSVNPKLSTVNGNTWIYQIDNAVEASGADSSNPILINHGFTDRFSFTFYDTQSSTSSYTYLRLRVLLLDKNNNTLASCYVGEYTGTTQHRIILYNNNLDGIDIYDNGVFKAGQSFSDWDNVSKISIHACSKSDNGIKSAAMFDDFLIDDDFILGIKDTVVTADSTIPWTWGIPSMVSYNYTAKLFDPDEEEIQNWTISTGTGVTSSGLNTINTDTKVIKPGTYTLRLYGQDMIGGNQPVYYLASKTFSYSIASSATMDLQTPEVRSGERVKVYCYQASGCTLEFDAPGSNTYQKTTISGNSVNIYYTIPDDCPSGTGVVILRDAQGNKLDFDYFEVSGSITQNSDITFDKDDYVNGDTVGIWYSWLPTGSTIVLKGLKDGDEVFRQTWTKGGTGKVTYDLSNEVDTLIAQLVYDGSILDQHSRYLATGDSAILSGVVYDSKTKAVVPGAFVSVDGMGVYADSAGRYNIAVSLGSHTFACSADNYHTATGNLTMRGNFVVNLYITPIETTLTGSSYYGNCADYNSASPLSGVTVTLSNSTDTLSTFSGTGGQFLINCANGTYTMRASKSGYDTVSYQVTVSGDTFNLIRLPASGSGVVTPPNPDDVDDTNYSAQPYGAYGRHAFDFDGDGKVSGEEWRYAVEHLSVALGCLMFLGFLTIVTRAGRR